MCPPILTVMYVLHQRAACVLLKGCLCMYACMYRFTFVYMYIYIYTYLAKTPMLCDRA